MAMERQFSPSVVRFFQGLFILSIQTSQKIFFAHRFTSVGTCTSERLNLQKSLLPICPYLFCYPSQKTNNPHLIPYLLQKYGASQNLGVR